MADRKSPGLCCATMTTSLRKTQPMKRGARESIQADRLGLLRSILEVVFALDDPLRQLSLALFCLHEQVSGDKPERVLLRSINLQTEHFEGLLPPDASVMQLMRRLQIHDPHITYPRMKGDEHIQTDAPLFEIVSSLELTGSNPQINWWVRAGQWSQWGLSAFDRLLLCRYARTAISEKETKYHRLLALLTLAVARRVDEAFPPAQDGTTPGEGAFEISIEAIRDDLASLEEMLNFLPKDTNLNRQAEVAIEDFVGGELLRYTDENHSKVRILPLINTKQ